jgi:hypothetical protein
VAAPREFDAEERVRGSVVLAYVCAAASLFAAVVPPVGIALAVCGLVFGRHHRFRSASQKWLSGARGMAFAGIVLSLAMAAVIALWGLEQLELQKLAGHR